MQTKGFIRVITVCLILVCAFYLSFSFVTNHYENIAEQKALAASGLKTPDTSNSKYKTVYNAYLDSISKEKVYLNYYTFQEVREKELGLGLDLKGGMNVTLQISVPDILRALSNDNPDKKFNQAINTVASNNRAQEDFVASFCNEYKRIAPEGSLYQIFRNVPQVKETPNATDAQVEKILSDEVNDMVENSYKVLRTRIDRFGVVAPNIQKLQSTGRILLELPGVKEPERVRKLLQGTANLEFYQTYNYSEIANDLHNLSAATAGGVQKAAADTAAADTAKAEAKEAAKPATAKPAAQKARTLDQLLMTGGQLNPSSPVVGVCEVTDTTEVNAILRSPAAAQNLPTDLKLRWTVKAIDQGGRMFELVALRTVQNKPVLTGDVITDASSQFDNLQGQVVSMTMNDEGARAWSRITGQNLGRSVAIVLDDYLRYWLYLG